MLIDVAYKKFERAQEDYVYTPERPKSFDAFAEGIALLARYGRLQYNIAAEHDILYLPWYETMSEDDILHMIQYGFIIDVGQDCWAYFT